MSELDTEASTGSAPLDMRALLYGQLVSRSLSAVAELGVADLLAAGPCTAAEVAARVDAHPDAVQRLLAGLSAFGVFRSDSAGRFHLTPLGSTLCSDTAGTAWPTAFLVGHEVGAAWAEFGTTIRTGKSAFEQVFGCTFFDFLAVAPGPHDIFHRSQAAAITAELNDLSETFDMTAYRHVIDIGGGDGTLLCSLLANSPDTKGVVFDRPGVVGQAAIRLVAAGLADRCSVRAGDFFAEVPHGADLYILSRILHDWSDLDAERILRKCRAAMGPTSTLLIVDLLREGSGTDAAARAAAVMDLYMLSLFGAEGGRERSVAELVSLLARSGFSTVGHRPLRSGVSIIEARVADEPGSEPQ